MKTIKTILKLTLLPFVLLVGMIYMVFYIQEEKKQRNKK